MTTIIFIFNVVQSWQSSSSFSMWYSRDHYNNWGDFWRTKKSTKVLKTLEHDFSTQKATSRISSKEMLRENHSRCVMNKASRITFSRRILFDVTDTSVIHNFRVIIFDITCTSGIPTSYIMIFDVTYASKKTLSRRVVCNTFSMFVASKIPCICIF